MQARKKAQLGMVAAALLGALVVTACEAPLPVAPVVEASPQATASDDPLGPPAF